MAAGLFTSVAAQARLEDLWVRPRHIWISRPDSGESFNGVYWSDGRYEKDAYKQICILMRDLHANAAVGMDPRLIDVLFGAQTWAAEDRGVLRPVVFTSGYRSPQTNRKIEGAAKDSQHMRGTAGDWLIPGVEIGRLGKMAVHFKVGGVGFYSSRGFVHTDTGRLRTWGS